VTGPSAGPGISRARNGLHPGVIIRDVLRAEFAELGDLRVAAYQEGDFLSDASHYVNVLPVLGTDGTGQILVAVEDDGPDRGRLLGTVMLLLWPDAGQVARNAEEAEVRALAVAPSAHGRPGRRAWGAPSGALHPAGHGYGAASVRGSGIHPPARARLVPGAGLQAYRLRAGTAGRLIR
jgi:hypothetical protein